MAAGSRPLGDHKAQQQEGLSDQSGIGHGRGDADDRPSPSQLDPALVGQPTVAGDDFDEQQQRRLEEMRTACERVAGVFDPLSPWGSASRAIEVRLRRALAAAQGQRLQPLPDEGHRP